MASLLTLTFSQPTQTLAAGDVLITEGDPGGDLYVLESGKLSVLRHGVAIATITEPGALIGEMSVLLGTPNSATVRADKSSTVRVVRDAVGFLERQPLVAMRVATLLAQRLDATSAVLVDLKGDAKGSAGEGMFNRLMSAMMGQK